MDKLFELITTYFLPGSGWGVVVLLLIAALFFGDKLMASAERFWATSRNISGFAFKRYSSSRLSNQLYHAAKVISRINEEFIPYHVRVKWVKSETAESFLKNGQVIIKIQDDDDINKSFVLAMMAFIRQGLLRHVKRQLHNEPLVAAIDLCAVDAILSQSYTDSLSFFEEHILDGQLAANEALAAYFGHLQQLDRNGLLFPVYLNELCKVFRTMSAHYPLEDYDDEALDFLRFLREFAEHSHKRLVFEGKYIRVAFGLIANRAYLARHGRASYVERICDSFSEGAQTVYLFGRGDRIPLTRQLARRSLGCDFRIRRMRAVPYRHVFDDNHVADGICVELSVWDAAPSPMERHEEVRGTHRSSHRH